MLIASAPYCAEDMDYFVNDFFVLRPYRGHGVAVQGAVQVFDQHRGKWALFTNPAPRNVVGQTFWRKTMASYTNGNYTEKYGDTVDGYKLIFRFENGIISTKES